MTLILAFGNREQIIQLSDRRITVSGWPSSEESNKAGLLVCANARLMFGFTGLAHVGSFNTHQWLLDVLYDSGPPDYIALSILERLKQRASEDFRNHPAIRRLGKRDRKLSIIFSGYLDGVDPPLGSYTIVTNFQDFTTGRDSLEAWDGFECTYWQEERPWEGDFSFIQPIGAWLTFTQRDESILRLFLEQMKPADAIIGKAVEMLREMADRKEARNTIGKQISVICLPRDPNIPYTTSYYTHTVSHNIFYPSQIRLTNDEDRLAVMDPMVSASHDKQKVLIVVPRVGRNMPCPCKSGKKYKHCHGR
jgi:hypothetical protein